MSSPSVAIGADGAGAGGIWAGIWDGVVWVHAAKTRATQSVHGAAP
jgi:hypothetical protein